MNAEGYDHEWMTMDAKDPVTKKGDIQVVHSFNSLLFRVGGFRVPLML